MTIAIEAVCRQCGRVYLPSPDDIRRGAWRLCPPCRDGPDSLRASRAGTSLTGANNAPEVSSKERV